MEGPPKKRRLLFLHADTRNPTTQRRTRSKSLDSKVRRHLMVDIGMSRRKPSKIPQFVTFVWPLAETSGALSSNGQFEHSTSRDFHHLQVPAKDLVVPETTAQYTALYTAKSPILHALSVFEKEWGEDWFSAYGFTLIMVAGRNAMGSSKGIQVLHRLQFSPLLRTQLARLTPFGSPSPSENPPSFITTDESSLHQTSLSHYTADLPESCDP